MGKFKEFLINEEIGLGEIGPELDRVFNSQWLSTQVDGAITSMDTGSIHQEDLGSGGSFGNRAVSLTGSTGLPNTDMGIPSVEKSGRITTLLIKRNPVYVRLSDGTEANFSYEEYKRIEGNPEIGKVMHITFQRNPADTSRQHSKIDKVIVRD